MFPRAFQIFTLLLVSASLVHSSPAPAPRPEPIDSNVAHVIAINKNMGCSGPQGCLAAQGSNGTEGAAAILATSGALSPRPGKTGALAAAFAVVGTSLSVAALL